MTYYEFYRDHREDFDEALRDLDWPGLLSALLKGEQARAAGMLVCAFDRAIATLGDDAGGFDEEKQLDDRDRARDMNQER